MIVDRDTWISGYRTMWLMVMFDLPVVEKDERKAATGFRNYLLDEGFHMAQYSVYYRLLDGKESVVATERRIMAKIPPRGSVQLLAITDKQYENMKVFNGRDQKPTEKPNQLVLF